MWPTFNVESKETGVGAGLGGPKPLLIHPPTPPKMAGMEVCICLSLNVMYAYKSILDLYVN